MKSNEQFLETNSQTIAIATRAQALYLLNILLLPFIAFVLLVFLYFRHQNHPSSFVRNHLMQAMRASLSAGFMLLLVSASIVLYGNLHHVQTWIILILYVLCLHSIFILYGVLALSHAISGKSFRYPIFGGRLDACTMDENN